MATHTSRGTKRRCGHCGAPFYDLNHQPIVCPKCHHEYVAQPRLPSRGPRIAPPPVLAEPEEESDRFEEDEVLAGEEEDESVLGGEDGEDGDEAGMRD